MEELKDSIKQGYYDVIRLREYWVDKEAKFIYKLEKTRNLNQVSTVVLASGDKEWADRTSAHYKLKITPDSP